MSYTKQIFYLDKIMGPPTPMHSLYVPILKAYSIDMSKGKAHVVDGEQERAGAEEQQPPTEGEMFATTKSILMHEVSNLLGDKI